MMSQNSFEPLSLLDAACEVPERVAVIEGERRVTYAYAAKLVSERIKTIERPAQGRPAFLTARADLEGLVDIWALLEAHVPAVLFSPKLTQAEKDSLRAEADSIEDALPEDAAFVIFTSGTTGRPKPAVLTRSSLAAGAKAAACALRMTSEDVFQLSLSPARVGGLGIVLRSLVVRSTISLAPRFSGKDFPLLLERDGVTLASLVPAMLSDVFEKCPDWSNPSGLKAILVGGAGMPLSLRKEAVRRGVPVVTTYGMTETGSSSAISDWEKRLSTDGIGAVPLDGVAYREVDGEIWLRGPMLFDNYWGRAPVVHDGWFATGDAGRVYENGNVEILARQSEIINTGGEKVVPVEVEAALEEIDGVAEALVFGVPDEKWGEIVTALLVADENKRPTSDALAAALSKKLARWKSPRRVAWVKSLPLTAAGKRRRRGNKLDGLAFEVLHYSASHD